MVECNGKACVFLLRLKLCESIKEDNPLSKLLIEGGRPLEGEVKIHGAKNSAVAIIAASILLKGETILENVPRISDVLILLDIIGNLGVEVHWLEEDMISIHVPDEIDYVARYAQVRSLRASNLLLGSLLGRCGKAEVSLPGGCDLGSRPMDLHIKGLSQLGANIETEEGYLKASAEKLEGHLIYLDFPSVGATENIMMAASVAAGQTVIENVAKEPEIVDLATFLNNAGAKIRGAGTDIIKIEGVSSLEGPRHAIIPDRMEAGTFMAIAALNQGKICMNNVIPAHLKPVIAKMKEVGVQISVSNGGVYVQGPAQLKAVDIKTLAHPGFPTDMQPPMMSVLSLAKGTSIVVENLFENRMQAANELIRMGADIKVDGQTAVIRGVDRLYGATVYSHDLRAGAAIVAAALAAEGVTEVNGLSVIDRGYLRIEEKLRKLGADIKRVE